MTRNPSCVVDTNVLISAALSPEGKPNRALRYVISEGTLLASNATFDEFSTRIRRPKFFRYLREEDREDYIALIRSVSRLVEPAERIRECRDPQDNKFLELAVAGHADAIVTGDEDLLVMHPFRGISIVAPAAFLALVSA